MFALGLLVRHPEAVRGAVLHEPSLYALSDDPVGVRNTLTALVTEGVALAERQAACQRVGQCSALPDRP